MNRVSYAEFTRTAEATRTAMTALSKSALDLGLDRTVSELVKLRASQINGCANCINLHAAEAIENGETQQRINLLGGKSFAALPWSEGDVCSYSTGKEMGHLHDHADAPPQLSWR